MTCGVSTRLQNGNVIQSRWGDRSWQCQATRNNGLVPIAGIRDIFWSGIARCGQSRGRAAQAGHLLPELVGQLFVAFI